ncbi:MAG: DNA methyltransferase [Candidatus Melainabacteria bacterium]|nr:DNA methyltransferase [Candidatus Melainabacteria bacterium]
MTMNQIICGEATRILSTFRPQSIDLVITDPPYLVRYRDRDGRTLANDDSPEAVLSVYAELYRVLKPNSYCISFYGWNAIAEFSEAWKNAGFKTVGHIVWTKPYASRASHTRYHHESAFILAKGFPQKPEDPMSDIQPWAYSGNKLHPTEKAVSVIEPLVQHFSKPGDIVLDPFSGAGSTSVAAKRNHRCSVGIELEAAYCEIARKRLAGVGSIPKSAKAG